MSARSERWRDRRVPRLLINEDSTRAVGIMRAGLALLLMMTWGEYFLLYKVPTLEGQLVAACLFTSTTLMLAGLWSRIATAVAGLTGLYILYVLGFHGGEAGKRFIHHHTALLVFATTILALTPCGRSLSLDRWLALRRAERRGEPDPEERGDLWAVWLLALLVFLVYFGAAVSKTTGGWLSGDRLEMLYTHFYSGAELPQSQLVPRLLQLMTIGIVALEWALALGLWFPRTHRWLMPLGVLLHIGFYVLLPVETFSLTTVLLYLAFIPPQVVHQTVGRLLPADDPGVISAG